MRAWPLVAVLALALPFLAGPAAAAPQDVQPLVVPGQPQTILVKGEGKPVQLVIRLHDGASLGGKLLAPKGCQGDDLSFNVIALSTSGQFIGMATCKVLPAGTHAFRLDGGQSAFFGHAHLYNATFA